MQKEALKLKRPTARSEGKPLHNQITFKVNADRLEQLSTAATADGISHHEKARRIVEASLDGDRREIEELRLEASELRQMFETQRRGLSEILAMILSLLPDQNGERLTMKVALQVVRIALEKGEV